MSNTSDFPDMKNTTDDESKGSPQANHTYVTLLKPFSEFNGVPPNKTVGTDVVCVEGFGAFNGNCKERRPTTTAKKTPYFMQMPVVIVVGILINPLFGLLSFLTHVFLAKRAKQTDKRREWRRTASRLYFTGVVITVGIWAVVLAYNCGLYYQNVDRTQQQAKKSNGKIHVHLKVLNSPSPVTISSYPQTQETERTTASKASTNEPPNPSHNGKASFEQFQSELSPFKSDQKVEGIQKKNDNDRQFPF